jgi:hypothetical protein
MIGKIGFFVAAASIFATSFLVYHAEQAQEAGDWIYGFLTVVWSLLMLFRLMSLTSPLNAAPVFQNGGLAAKLIVSLRLRQVEEKESVLKNSLGGTYVFFLSSVFLYFLWQLFFVFSMEKNVALSGLFTLIQSFDPAFTFGQLRFFAWGRIFTLGLTFILMAFVLRSYAAEKSFARNVLFALYPVVLAGLLVAANPVSESSPFFKIILENSGLPGMSLLVFALFIPVGSICVNAQSHSGDWVITACGITCAMLLIVGLFQPFVPTIAAILTLCFCGILLAWGSAETDDSIKSLTLEQN